MTGVKICDKCEYQHGRENCCTDIYQQIGQTKGPTVTGKIFLAFVLPLLAFIASLMTAEYLLSAIMSEGGIRTFIALSSAIAATAAFVQLVRIFNKKHELQKTK